ncbi:MAG: DNA-directed RNA polymerase subunit beta', partial [bacterium]
EAVGVMAAQSIGEPGTQLTLKTFHIGGTAVRIAEQSKITAKADGKVKLEKVKSTKRAHGKYITLSRDGILTIRLPKKGKQKYKIPYGARLEVEDGQHVKKGDSLFEWDPYSMVILSEAKGRVEFSDIVEGVTLREELDERTGRRQPVIIEQKEKTLQPKINIVSASGRKLASSDAPTGAYILVREGQQVSPGDILAKIPREVTKTRDITGGLPRVAELFEARKPKNQAIVTEIDGVVSFGEPKRGYRTMVLTSDTGERKEYAVPFGKHLRVHEGERVTAGEKLCEGPINPHDILSIKGATAVQEYLVNEIQEVYRLQGVSIDDKHIAVIVRQMLQKVRIEDPGDTIFIEGETLDKVQVKEENERVIKEGGKPATFRPLLLGITKAALTTESFISAASFQETTKVLTEAAIHGKRDSLLGLKENVIMGSLIPAGTGLRQYKDLKVVATEEEEETKAAG